MEDVFQCLQCGACCRQPGFVYLREEDVMRLAAHLQMELHPFTEKHCLLLDRRHLVLKKHGDETCIFAALEKCSVYAGRPDQCRDYPLKWKTERSSSYCKGLSRKV